MKTLRVIASWTLLVLACAGAGTFGGYYAAFSTLTTAAGEPAQAKVIFPRPDQVEVQVPSVVRGKRIICIIFADVKRRLSSVSC